MFVICDKGVLNYFPMRQIMSDIIGHENVHAEQTRRRGNIEFSLPSPTDRKNYFSNKEEIMAFSFTIANELHRGSSNLQLAMNQKGFGGQSGALWSEIKKYCDVDVLKRYRKYIYLYLEKMYEDKK